MDQFVVDLGAGRQGRSRATRWCCSAPAITVSRRRRTGPTGATPSATRSSPGSALGCPASTSDATRDGGTAEARPERGLAERRRAWSPASPRWPRVAWRSVWSWSGGSSPSGSTRSSQDEAAEAFFALRSDGPTVTTPDGVVLHTEVDELPTDAAAGTTRRDLTLVLRARLRAEHGLLALPAQALPRPDPVRCSTTSARTVARAAPRRSSAGCRSWPTICCRSWTRWPAPDRWCWSVTRWAG